MFRRLTIVIAVLVAAAIASAASASVSRSLFGQCGGPVHSGAQLLNSWRAMSVINSPQVKVIAARAGWNSMDGSVTSFISQRGKQFQLAAPASIEDFGCQPGTMFSVGNRPYGAGEWVIGIVPGRFVPSQVSGTPCAGCHRVVVWVWVVGRGNCSNGFSAFVPVIMYVHVAPKPCTCKPKPRPRPKPKPAPLFIGTISKTVQGGGVSTRLVFHVAWSSGGKQGSFDEQVPTDAKHYCVAFQGTCVRWPQGSLITITEDQAAATAAGLEPANQGWPYVIGPERAGTDSLSFDFVDKPIPSTPSTPTPCSNCAPPPCTTCTVPKTPPNNPGGGGPGNPSQGNPQPPGVPDTPPSQSSAPPGAVSNDPCQDPANTAMCQAPPP